MLLLQEFDIKTKDKKGTKNLVVDYLLRMEGSSKKIKIYDGYLNEQLFAIEDIKPVPWLANYVDYLVVRVLPQEFSY